MDSLVNPVPEPRRRSGLAPFLVLPTALPWSINVLRTSGWIASPWFLFEAIKGVVLLALAAGSGYLMWRYWDTPPAETPLRVERMQWLLGVVGIVSLATDLVLRR
jgi:hypothetical protein